MATLQKIRTQAGLLVAIITGLALFSFILGDLFRSGSSMFQKDRMEVGAIDGESVQYPDFQRKVEELGDIYRSNSGQSQLDEATWQQVREQTWQELVREKVMGDAYKELGLGVSSEEMFDLIQGNDPHSIILQIFSNPETGQFDRDAVVNFLKNLDTAVSPEQRSYWLFLENQILNERLSSKYNTLINKALFVTGQEAQASLEAGNKLVNVELVGLPLSVIADSAVKVTSPELVAYYNKHKDQYNDEKTRSIEFVTFTVVPSQADYTSAEKWINEIKDDFSVNSDNILFVNSNSDESFYDVWYKASGLTDSLDTWIFGKGAAVGDVYGPYFEDNSYKLARLHSSEMMPDSVKARHILLRANTQAEYDAAQALADSLKGVVEKGGDFATLARLYSTDTGSAINGGDLGWFGRGMMVKPFEEAAFNNKVNEVKVVESQFGIHIVQTTQKGAAVRQVQVAILVRNVTPSTQTYQAAYAKASKFASNNTSSADFDKSVEAEKLVKRSATLHEEDITLAGLDNPRALVRAAFKTKVGSILKNTDGSPIFEMGDNFVIAVLTGATEEGVAPFESVKQRVELALSKEKKSEMLVQRLKKAGEGNSDLYSLASAVGSQVTIASGISFNNYFIPDFGMEPAVVGTAVSLEPNVISEPVVGNSAVFLVKVTSIEEGFDTNVEAERVRLAQGNAFRANMQSFEVHKNSVKIEDKRSKFY